ncbi:hypothetical protein K469DRAFT_706746 [Zopfia rhizophila CBS 207.26]|uniref:Uncharacterized protein n=1 Tax=Zopfia rhizophila CBS 207.26 TaxID=1314779 RepID=A0A6A6E4L4_9PEZI|nr:hypothetical protein K469DRAFT_706746 [Zopfia rhizophila CBS 207.26]
MTRSVCFLLRCLSRHWTKIEPLRSPTKTHVPRSDHGVVGEAADLEHTHIAPLDGGSKDHHHTAPHADSQGVVGREDIVQGSKIPPLEGGMKQATQHTQGLDDESVDKSRIDPMGNVRD